MNEDKRAPNAAHFLIHDIRDLLGKLNAISPRDLQHDNVFLFIRLELATQDGWTFESTHAMIVWDADHAFAHNQIANLIAELNRVETFEPRRNDDVRTDRKAADDQQSDPRIK